MPRRFLKRVLPQHHVVREQWFLRPFGALLHDPALWATHRRNVLRATALGISICFIPFPIHTAAAAVLAVYLRVNVPVAIVASWFANPLTMGPLYYGAYRLGLAVLGRPPSDENNGFSLESLADQMDDVLLPLLLGCALLAAIVTPLIWSVLNWLWVVSMRRRFRRRSGRS